MNYEKIYSWIMGLANQKAKKDELSALHVIYGCAQLISMDDAMLENLFHDDEATEEIENIRELFRRNNIDADTLKKNLSMLLSFRLKAEYSNSVPEMNNDIPVSAYLSALLEIESEVVEELAKAGSSKELRYLKEEMTMPYRMGTPSSEPSDMFLDERDPTRFSEVTDAKKPDVSFHDIIGAERAKEMLIQFADIMKNPQNHRYGEYISPRGILLYGPPGTGKTMLAKAMASEAGAAFYAVNATDLMCKYVGEGEERIRALFRKAQKNAPAIIFIDEIDAIAKKRTGERNVESYLNALLTEMEGFSCDSQRRIFVLAATNFYVGEGAQGDCCDIDPALLRRFDDRIRVDLPDKEERKEYIRMIMDKCGIDSVSETAMASIADRTTGQSLAVLKNILQLALCKADKYDIPLRDKELLEAFEEYQFGEKRIWNDADCQSTAYHEAGHAYISYLAGHTPSFVSIVSRGRFGGYMQKSEDNTFCRSREDIIWEIRVALAGRASEMIFTGEDKGINTGASEDLKQASALAINMICRYGMAENSLLCLDLNAAPGSLYSKDVLEKADQILRSEMETTKKLIEEGRNRIEHLSRTLLDKSQLIKEQIKKCLEDGSVNLIEGTSSAYLA